MILNSEVIVLHRSMDINKLIEDLTLENKTVFVCGGSSIYEYFLDNFIIDEIYFSKIKSHVEVQEAKEPLFFPKLDDYGYKNISEKEFDDFTAYVYSIEKF